MADRAERTAVRLFFFLPMGLMAMISLLTGNPVVQPNVDLRPNTIAGF
jgi:hypothetical protein